MNRGASPNNTQRIIITEKLPLNGDATDEFVSRIAIAIDNDQPIRVIAAGKEFLLDPIRIEVQ